MNKRRAPGASLDVVALCLLALETLATAAIAVGYVIYGLLDDSFTALGWSLAGVAAVMAAGIGIFTWGFARRKRFALGGAVTWQLMQASVGVSLVSALPLVGVVLVVAALVVSWAAVRRLGGGHANARGNATAGDS